MRGLHFSASHLQRREYLHERDVTVAVLSEGTYGESKPYADFLGYTVPWYSARASTALTAGRDFGYIACYLRNHDHAYETYWSTDRGTEAMGTSYHLLDLTVFGRQEGWEDSPQGWPRLSAGQHQWRALGRPTVQWAVTDEQVAQGAACPALAHRFLGPTGAIVRPGQDIGISVNGQSRRRGGRGLSRRGA